MQLPRTNSMPTTRCQRISAGVEAQILDAGVSKLLLTHDTDAALCELAPQGGSAGSPGVQFCWACLTTPAGGDDDNPTCKKGAASHTPAACGSERLVVIRNRMMWLACMQSDRAPLVDPIAFYLNPELAQSLLHSFISGVTRCCFAVVVVPPHCAASAEPVE